MTDLGTLHGLSSSAAVAINNRSRIIGRSYTPGGPERAFLWQNGRLIDLTPPGGKSSRAVAINDRGQIIGQSRTRTGGERNYLWENGKLTDFGAFPGVPGTFRGVAINERGQIVGLREFEAHYKDGDPILHAFLWEMGKVTDLGTLPRGKESGAVAINDQGQIIGWSDTKAEDKDGFTNPHAVLWTLKRG